LIHKARPMMLTLATLHQPQRQLRRFTATSAGGSSRGQATR
jgi:hypothetical protein